MRLPSLRNVMKALVWGALLFVAIRRTVEVLFLQHVDAHHGYHLHMFFGSDVESTAASQRWQTYAAKSDDELKQELIQLAYEPWPPADQQEGGAMGNILIPFTVSYVSIWFALQLTAPAHIIGLGLLMYLVTIVQVRYQQWTRMQEHNVEVAKLARRLSAA